MEHDAVTTPGLLSHIERLCAAPGARFFVAKNALAREWFGDYMEPTWRRKSAEEARGVFRQLGLTSEFWLER